MYVTIDQIVTDNRRVFWWLEYSPPENSPRKVSPRLFPARNIPHHTDSPITFFLPAFSPTLIIPPWKIAHTEFPPPQTLSVLSEHYRLWGV